MAKVITVKNEQQKTETKDRIVAISWFQIIFSNKIFHHESSNSFYFQILFGNLCYFYSFSGVLSSSLIS